MRTQATLFLLAALGLPTSALAMDPRLPLLDEDPAVEAKLKSFKQAYANDAKVLAALESAARSGVPARDRIHKALLALPKYSKAVAEYEKSGDNADAWRAVRAGAQDQYLRAHATYFLGRALLNQDELEAAAEALEQVQGRLRTGTAWTDETTLYLGYAYARIPELRDGLDAASRSRARQLLESLLAKKGKVPERVAEGATWLLRELRGEGLGPLLELAKRMETIERMIRRTRTGQGTQKRQEKVLKAIDKLIALMREKEKT